MKALGIDSEFLLRDPPPDWQEVRIRREQHHLNLEGEELRDCAARLELADDTVATIDRDPATATFVSPEPVDDDFLLHPFLMVAASVLARWRGWESFHGGAVVGREGAWALVGHSQIGKSSLLAALACRGMPVLSDDLLVVDAGCGLAGPRFVDLRRDSSEWLGVRERALPVRGGERRRLAIAPVAPKVPIAGWIFLGWGGEIASRSLPPSERLPRIASGRMALGRGLRVPPVDPVALLDLARLPAWELVRPRGGSSLARSVDLVAELVG
jgi:hypothetical protein